MDPTTIKYKEALISMRHHLHQYPEIAHHEENTALYLQNFLKQFGPDELITDIAGHGLAAIFNSNREGPSVMIRCELDALPIREKSQVKYRSVEEDKAHLCGHDGHMVMVAGLAPMLSVSPPSRGSVILLFQPAEETGEGASMVLQDKKFLKIQPDWVFALHNLPGYNASSVIIKKGVFASASKGLIIEMEGSSSHAGHPEGGNNPASAVAQLIQSASALPQKCVPMHEAALITPIHARIGHPAFGTSPGEGVVMFTVRAHSNDILEILESELHHLAKHIADAFHLSCNISMTEPFEAVLNDDECIDVIEKCATHLNLDVIKPEIPFPWSEDFGVFTGKYKGALFGLGSGSNMPQLHNEDYDFPDQLIEEGTAIFYKIVGEILNIDK